MGLFSEMFAWWKGNTIGTRLFTWRKGIRVGEDGLGNIYYRERNGVRRWVTQQAHTSGFEKYQQDKQRQAQFIHLLMQTRDELAALFNSDKSDAHKSRQKPLIYAGLRQRYAELKTEWNDSSRSYY